ncbi:hypothetical protein LLG90_13350 [Aromatoleum toluclasticum]|uniref:hypothetical protein n=1 Tax=Aromatoleum toluclasticum TaxID=92003 RepID=UPI001D18629D|nr:hypothetical protein [Aromatoleum toluclasticum]MCC4116340.1 hypothetical protein [Aromatoleum toluclasticum]
MSWNPYKRLVALLPGAPLLTGQVIAVHADGVTIQLSDSAQLRVRGEAAVGDHVYVRGGVIEGPAPALTGVDQAV